MRPVLIVDDQEQVRRLTRTTLDGGRFAILEAADAAQAIALAREHRPALVFLDWGLPDRSGVEVCRELRADPGLADAHVVMLTGRDEAEDREAALAAGADDFIAKPVVLGELLVKVRQVLGPEALA